MASFSYVCLFRNISISSYVSDLKILYNGIVLYCMYNGIYTTIYSVLYYSSVLATKQTLYTELHPSPFHYCSETHMMTVSRQYQPLYQWVPSRHDLTWMSWKCQVAVLQLNEVSWAWWARPVTPASWFQIAGNKTNLVYRVKACLTPSQPEKQKQKKSQGSVRLSMGSNTAQTVCGRVGKEPTSESSQCSWLLVLRGVGRNEPKPQSCKSNIDVSVRSPFYIPKPHVLSTKFKMYPETPPQVRQWP